MPLYRATGKPVRLVFLDFETQSAESIEFGSAKYAEHPTTRAYMAALVVYDEGQQDPQCYLWTDRPFPITPPQGWQHVHDVAWLQQFFADERVELWCVAHNVSFERNILTYVIKARQPDRWLDTLDIAYSRGLPGSLDKLGEIVYGLPKDKKAVDLVRRVCAPIKTGKRRGCLPSITQVEVQQLIPYNIQDVRICEQFTRDYGLLIEDPPFEQAVRDCHQYINERGIGFDIEFALNLDAMERYFIEMAHRKVVEVTNGDLTGDDLERVAYLRDAINANLPADLQIPDLRATTLEQLLADAQNRDDVGHEVLEVVKARLVVSRAALDKVKSGLAAVNSDGRIRDQFVYWGASTGRWTGRITQPQNMKRPDDAFDIAAAIEAVKTRDFRRFMDLCVDAKGRMRQPYELLGSLIRGIFIPAPGHRFVVGDFASIEARVLMWLAGQEDGLDEHRRADAGEIDDVYCAFASEIYQRRITKADKKERQVGKVGQLACGYGGGSGAVLRMATVCGVDLAAAGIVPDDVVRAWRAKYAAVPRYWRAVETAFRRALQGSASRVGACSFDSISELGGQTVRIRLPSGRYLCYPHARDVEVQDRSMLTYTVYNRGVKREKYVYGGLLTENIDQATSRDCLAAVMVRALYERGYFVPLHVHDELVLEVPEAQADEAAAWLKEAMQTPPEWASGLPLRSDPVILDRYGKA